MLSNPRTKKYISISLAFWVTLGSFCLYLFVPQAQAMSMDGHCMEFSNPGTKIIDFSGTGTRVPECCVDQNETVVGEPGRVMIQNLDLQSVDLVHYQVVVQDCRICKTFFTNATAPPGLLVVGSTILRE